MTSETSVAAPSTVPWRRFVPLLTHEGRPWSAETGQAGQVSVRRLARFLSPVAVMRDFLPTTPWVGVDRVPVTRPVAPASATEPAELAERLDGAVSELIAGRGTVAVSASGGLDSLVVLAAARRVSNARIVAVVSDDVDEAGRSPAALVARQVAALGGGVDIAVIDSLAGAPLPRWRPAGPGFHSTPREHAALADAAERSGAEIMLYGGGADQLLACPGVGRGAAVGARLARRPVLAAIAATGWAVGPRGPRRAAAFFTATSGRRYRRAAGPDLLTADLADQVRAEFVAFARGQVAHHVRQGWGLHRALLCERLSPHDALPAATDLPLRSPFLQPLFADYCWRLPMGARWDPRAPTVYQQRKGLLAALLPSAVRTELPPATMLSVTSGLEYWRAEDVDPMLLVRHGLLRADWRTRCRSIYDVQMVAECERWLAAAVARGAEIVPGDDREIGG